MVLFAWAVCASEPAVPPQAGLIARVAPFDGSLAGRGKSRFLPLVAIRRDDAVSRQVAAEVISALRAEPDIAGLPFEVEQVEVREARELVAELRTRHPAILYLAMKGDRERCLEEMGRRADLSGAVAAAARLEASAAGMVSRLQAAFDAPRAAAG